MKYAVFGFASPNLGDDVQAIAAALLLPQVDAYVDRDALDRVRLPERHRVIMNSWFAIKRYRATPSASIEPIYFGQCVGRPELLNEAWLAEWRKHEPIGCRDTASVNILRSNCIDAHFTGCLTSYMGRFIEKPEQREGILFVDVPEAMEKFIPQDIRARARRITNETADQKASPKQRLRAAAKLLDQMRTAEMVVTRRLHSALPCIGFETPVTVYLNGDKKNRGRFSGSDAMLPMVFHENDKPIGPEWLEPKVCTVPRAVEQHFAKLVSDLGTVVTPRWRSVAEFVETMPDFARHAPSIFTRYFSSAAAIPVPL